MKTSRYQSGLSLIELMIAALLGMIIVWFMADVYANVTRATREMARTNSQIENARYAMQFIRNDAVHAGYWGAYIPEWDDLLTLNVPTNVPSIVPDPCLAFDQWPDATTPGHEDSLLGLAVQVHDAVPGTCAALLTNKLADTDVLVIRHADRCEAGAANCVADDPEFLYLQASNCEAEIDAGNHYVLDDTAFPLTERDCTAAAGGTPAVKRRFRQDIYYVRDYLDQVGDGIPTLMRSTFGVTAGQPAQQAPNAMVAGIDRFRVEVGVDSLSETGAAVDYTAGVDWQDLSNRITATNRGDGVQDGPFIHCGSGCTVAQLNNVVAMRVHLLGRATSASPGYTDTKTYTLGDATVAAFNDSFKRHAFSTTIRLATVSGRRETP